MHNPIVGYDKITVKEIPLSVFDSPYDCDSDNETLKSTTILNDNGFASDESYGKRDKELMLASLTARQRRIAFLLAEGYTRVEIAKEVGTCTQAVHQIILRIRKRLAAKAGVDAKRWRTRGGY